MLVARGSSTASGRSFLDPDFQMLDRANLAFQPKVSNLCGFFCIM